MGLNNRRWKNIDSVDSYSKSKMFDILKRDIDTDICPPDIPDTEFNVQPNTG